MVSTKAAGERHSKENFFSDVAFHPNCTILEHDAQAIIVIYVLITLHLDQFNVLYLALLQKELFSQRSGGNCGWIAGLLGPLISCFLLRAFGITYSIL